LLQRVEFALHKDRFDSLRDATLECVALSCLLTDENGWYSRRKKEEGRRKKEEGRRKKEEGRRKKQ
jgi:hypothetical protein